MISKKGFEQWEVMKVMLWILFIILAVTSVYFLFKRFGVR